MNTWVNPWAGYLREQAGRFTRDLLSPCVLNEDADAIHGALGLSELLTDAQPQPYGWAARIRLVEVVIGLTAHALASDARAGAYVLLRWLHETEPGEIEAWLLAAQEHLLAANRSGALPSSVRPGSVTNDDLNMVFVLVTALGFESFSARFRAAARLPLDRLGFDRVFEEIDRIALAAELPSAARSGWQGRLTALES